MSEEVKLPITVEIGQEEMREVLGAYALRSLGLSGTYNCDLNFMATKEGGDSVFRATVRVNRKAG